MEHPSSPFIENPAQGVEDGEDSALELRNQVEYWKYQFEQSKSDYSLLVEETDSQRRDLERKIRELGEQSDALSSDQRFLLDQKTAVEAENRTLREKLEKSERNSQSKARELHATIEEMSEELNSLSNRLDVITAQNQEKTQHLNGQLEVKSAEVTRLSEELSLQKHLTQKASMKAEELSQQLSATSVAKNDDSDAKALRLLESEYQIQQEHVHDLEKKVLDSERTIATLRGKRDYIEVLKEEKASLQRQLGSVKQVEEQKNQIERENAVLVAKLESWSKAIGDTDPSELLEQMNVLRSEKQYDMEVIAKLKEELRKSQDEGIALNGVKLKLEHKLSMTESSITDKEVEVSVAEKKLALAKQEIQYHKELLESMRSEQKAWAERRKQEATSEVVDNETLNDLKLQVAAREGEIDALNRLNSELKAALNQGGHPQKRQRLDEDDRSKNEELIHEIRNQMVEIRNLNDSKHDLIKENLEIKSQLSLLKLRYKELQEKKEPRVLQLADNPTARHERISKQMLETLQKENNELLGKVADAEKIPKSVYDRLVLEQEEMKRREYESRKRLQRLQEAYSKKTGEFNQVVYKLLGYKLEYLSDTRLKLISKFFPNFDSEADEEDYIIIDVVKNNTVVSERNVKVSGLAANVVQNLLGFWVQEKNDISCFLSALNLQLFEEQGNR